MTEIVILFLIGMTIAIIGLGIGIATLTAEKKEYNQLKLYHSLAVSFMITGVIMIVLSGIIKIIILFSN